MHADAERNIDMATRPQRRFDPLIDVFRKN
jgi:hypothetical protein